MSGKRVLLIEDDPVNAKVYHHILQSNGCEVVHTDDGIRGLEMARKVSPDLILLDWLLPRLDGYKICKLLKMDPRYRKTPVVVLTAISEPSELERIKEAGAEEVLQKSAPIDGVREVLRNYLDIEVKRARRLDS